MHLRLFGCAPFQQIPGPARIPYPPLSSDDVARVATTLCRRDSRSSTQVCCDASEQCFDLVLSQGARISAVEQRKPRLAKLAIVKRKNCFVERATMEDQTRRRRTSDVASC